MSRTESLFELLKTRFGDVVQNAKLDIEQITLEVAADTLIDTLTALRDEPDFAFAQLIDLAGVDYSAYGKAEWATSETQTFKGFSRAVEPVATGRSAEIVRQVSEGPQIRRFAAVYHLLSIAKNVRLRVRCYAPDDELPVLPSVADIWNVANWYEREAFDLYGIVFEGHPDLRRLLTDYGFIGHPFRKDFPLIGQVEMRYDPARGRVVYEPVSIEPRVLVPRVVRKDHRQEISAEKRGNSHA